MKTLKTTLFVVLFCFVSNIFSQTNNIKNPPELSEEQKTALKNIQELPVSDNIRLKSKILPTSIDNSENIFFPPIKYQLDWSCGQQSGVEYVFTYEMNCAKRTDGIMARNQYASHFTWNYLNRSSAELGASYFDSWRIIKEFGHPNKSVFDPGDNNLIWMNGYDNYLAAMKNRIEEIYSIRVDSEEGLIKLKNWLVDHAGESIYGGVANYYGTSDYYGRNIPSGTPEAGKLIITEMYETATHALTIVGYNDAIRYDYNMDGRYTNDVDINGDGVVNLRDWEIGAFKVANSYSSDWADEGFVYVMYRLAAEPPEIGGFWNNSVNVIKVKTDYSPKLTLKASIKYTSRHRIKVMAGFANDTTATEPEIIKEFPILNYQGGARYMRGIDLPGNETLEFGLDITQFYAQANINQFAKFFLIVNENDYSEYAEGEIISFSVIDYTNNNEETIANISSPIDLHHGNNMVSLVKKLINNPPIQIADWTIPVTHPNEPFEKQFTAYGGVPPYHWDIYQDNYDVEIVTEKFNSALPDIILFPTSMNSKVEIDLDFTFPFYGKNYNSIFVTTNGTILFDEDLFLYPYIFFRDYALATRKGIAVFGANDQKASYYNRVFKQVISNEAIHIYWELGHYYMSAVSLKYHVKLYKNGNIEFNFNDFDALGLTWVSGVSNGNETEFTVSPLANRQQIADSTVIRFTPPQNYFTELSIDEHGLLKGIAPNEVRETSFNIKVTDFTGAYAVKKFYYQTWPNNIGENKQQIQILCYPNPVNEYLFIELPENIDFSGIEIYNLLGQKMLEKTLKSNTEENKIQFDEEIFKPGIYIVKAIGNNITLENKFIKN